MANKLYQVVCALPLAAKPQILETLSQLPGFGPNVTKLDQYAGFIDQDNQTVTVTHTWTAPQVNEQQYLALLALQESVPSSLVFVQSSRELGGMWDYPILEPLLPPGMVVFTSSDFDEADWDWIEPQIIEQTQE